MRRALVLCTPGQRSAPATSFTLPHAEAHAAVLPHALAHNASAAPQALQRIARTLGLAEAAQVPGMLYDLAALAGMPLGLKDLRMPEDGIGLALDPALRQPYPNPRPLERQPLRVSRRPARGSPARIATSSSPWTAKAAPLIRRVPAPRWWAAPPSCCAAMA